MWFIGVEVEQETGVPPPKKNPGSAPVTVNTLKYENLVPWDTYSSCEKQDEIGNFWEVL